jgi:hypothetical protein
MEYSVLQDKVLPVIRWLWGLELPALALHAKKEKPHQKWRSQLEP